MEAKNHTITIATIWARSLVWMVQTSRLTPLTKHCLSTSRYSVSLSQNQSVSAKFQTIEWGLSALIGLVRDINETNKMTYIHIHPIKVAPTSNNCILGRELKKLLKLSSL